MLTSILLGALAIILVFLTIWWYVTYFRYEVYLKRFNGPSHLPIIGNLHNFVIKANVVLTLSELMKEYKSPMKFFLGYHPVLALADPKSIEFFLTSNTILTKNFTYEFFEPWLGKGLLTSDGMRWKKHRKLLTPAFHFQILERFIDVFDSQSNILLKKLERVKDEEVDIYPYITLHALDVICEATMNTSLNAQSNPTSNYVRSVKEMCRITLERTITLKMFDICYKFSRDYQKEKKAVGILHALSNSVIKKRREELVNQQPINLEDKESKKRVPFLDLLLTSTVDGQPLTNEAVREEVDTFLFEGHDTTTSGISFTLYLLSKHQEVQDRVFEEITEIFGDEETLQLSYENLQKTKYLEQVVKEALRMYPSVPLISRLVTEDVVYDGQVIPKGVVLILFLYQLHRDASLFTNPDEFDPERFNPENSKNMTVYSYVPFSAGPRNCIGQKFAMLELKGTVIKILHKFKLLPVVGHQPQLKGNAVIISENGLPVRLQKRRKM
ncbi:hypothetical protein FQR65_LT03776 [Abscondita terminalis]|nr:hypothetical protein FQR65_LT03776 [Abscondita terminalis]